MGEEVKMSEYDGDDGERVLDWESGLPSIDDLTPLSQPLIPPELASAFSISPVTFRTAVEVNQASQDTLSSLRGLKSFASGGGESHESAVLVDDGDGEEEEEEYGDRDSRKETGYSGEEGSGRTSAKRPRLVWTPQLHKRFVDVVGHLGIKNAVPKTIMQLMNVEGLTRENVASHLQKYRLYLKRMHGISPSDSPSPSDHLFDSAPPPPPPPTPPAMIPMMGMGMPPPHPYHHHHHHHYSMMQHHHQQHGDWASNSYASLVNYPHVSPSDN